MNNSNGPFLIVDDEPEMCWTLDLILKRVGGVCRTASNAREAMALAESQSFRVAFLDAKLPDDEGLNLARRLQASNPGMRIVIVSGFFYHDDPIITGAIQSGLISAFVAKPFEHEEILRAIGSPHPAARNRKRPPVIQGKDSIVPAP